MKISQFLWNYDKNIRPECEVQVKGFAGAIYKKFKTQSEANQFIEQKRTNATLSTVTQASTGLVGFVIINFVLNLNSLIHNTHKNRLFLKTIQNKRPNTLKKPPATESGSSGSGQAAKKSKINEEKTNDFTSNITQMKVYGGHHFLEDTEGFVHVYTDGSCENNGRPNAIAGYGVYFTEGHSLYVLNWRFHDQCMDMNGKE